MRKQSNHNEEQKLQNRNNLLIEEIKEEDEEEEREELPYYNDPKVKISIWTILKDSIGKDLTKITLPVYFNDPLSVLQRMASGFEYHKIMDRVATDPDPVKRLALLAVFSISSVTSVEKAIKKPFNPLLGETYEYEKDGMQFLAE